VNRMEGRLLKRTCFQDRRQKEKRERTNEREFGKEGRNEERKEGR